MSPGLLTAGNGQNWENDLVAALDRPGSGMTVIRRCVDVADVLAAATTGQASVVVLSAGLRRLDTEVVQRLAAAGVAILGIHPAGDERVKARLTRLVILNLIADDVGAPALLAAARVAVTARTSETPTPPGSAPVGFADPRLALPSADRIPGPPEPAPPATRRPVAASSQSGARSARQAGARWPETWQWSRPPRACRPCWSTPTSTVACRRARSGYSTSHPAWPEPADMPPTAGWTWPS